MEFFFVFCPRRNSFAYYNSTRMGVAVRVLAGFTMGLLESFTFYVIHLIWMKFVMGLMI